MEEGEKTVDNHFRHYYSNRDVGNRIAIFLNKNNKYDELDQAINFGIIKGLLLGTTPPIHFFNLHKDLPDFKNLPEDLKKVIRGADKVFSKMINEIENIENIDNDKLIENVKEFILATNKNKKEINKFITNHENCLEQKENVFEFTKDIYL